MEGRRIRVRGQVQGVGFRPFIWQLAKRFDIKGDVLNDPEGVLIHAAGSRLDAFEHAISTDAPPLARVDSVEAETYRFEIPPKEFAIAVSRGVGAETRVTPDAATCAQCRADVFGEDPRRKGYAFTNCTHCGPRFTILHGLPYDRSKTTMAEFEMCAACAAEYVDPADRRFHAQPVACVDCGPQLALDGISTAVFNQAAERLRAGEILAVKGLGGFHLCCDATNPNAIALLRDRKKRPTKPLALMGRQEDIDRFAKVSSDEQSALEAAAAPIVLLATAEPLPKILAPGQERLGWMLPYTPLHHLLLDAIKRPLVMTSGNISGEPQVIGNSEAREKLRGLVDGVVDHNRDIARRLDDSVLQITAHGPMVLRRARGMVPETLPLPPGFDDAPQVVAFGAHLKSAICLIKNGQALLSHHLGDLDEALTYEEFLKADADYADLFDHDPTVFACDLHEGYQSSQHARARAQNAPLIEVQHHHAHLAACLAENGWPRDGGHVAGIILDGLGLGADGTIWGGEILLGDYDGFERSAYLAPVPLVGGEAAQREPWRTAVMRLDRAGYAPMADRLFAEHPLSLIRQAAAAGLNAPLSSSAGRLFDAFAATIGQAPRSQSFEGEAAMQLEALARSSEAQTEDGPYLFGNDQEGGPLDDSDLWHRCARDIKKGVPRATMARRFHTGVAASFARQARHLVDSGQAKAVALSGGCFQNALLLEETMACLEGVPVLLHNRVPANDGGLALGQATIAAAATLSNR